MPMWQRLVDWLALTSTERKVILFLAGTLLVGAALRVVRETFPQRRVDYSAVDSTFAALTANLTADTLHKPFTAGSRLNLNTATKEELTTLPGIGTVMAERIVQYRATRGPFKSLDDLLKIHGISKKRLEQIKIFLTIDTQTSTLTEE